MRFEARSHGWNTNDLTTWPLEEKDSWLNMNMKNTVIRQISTNTGLKKISACGLGKVQKDT